MFYQWHLIQQLDTKSRPFQRRSHPYPYVPINSGHPLNNMVFGFVFLIPCLMTNGFIFFTTTSSIIVTSFSYLCPLIPHLWYLLHHQHSHTITISYYISRAYFKRQRDRSLAYQDTIWRKKGRVEFRINFLDIYTTQIL